MSLAPHLPIDVEKRESQRVRCAAFCVHCRFVGKRLQRCNGVALVQLFKPCPHTPAVWALIVLAAVVRVAFLGVQLVLVGVLRAAKLFAQPLQRISMLEPDGFLDGSISTPEFQTAYAEDSQSSCRLHVCSVRVCAPLDAHSGCSSLATHCRSLRQKPH